MLNLTKELLKSQYGFKEETFDLYERALKDVEEEFKKYDEVLKKYKEIKIERWSSN